jgi:hypothetical protein
MEWNGMECGNRERKRSEWNAGIASGSVANGMRESRAEA